MQDKTSKKCDNIKPLTEFCNRKGEKDGKHRYCKTCLNGDFKEYYHTSRRKDSDYYKTYRKENKEYLNNTYCTTPTTTPIRNCIESGIEKNTQRTIAIQIQTRIPSAQNQSGFKILPNLKNSIEPLST